MIEDEWETYKKYCYKGKDIHPIQEKETRQAFYAGGFSALNITIESLDKGLSEVELTHAFQKLYKEFKEVLTDYTRQGPPSV